MALRDRVTDRAVRLPPADALPGRYVVGAGAAVAFGPLAAAPGDPLVAIGRGWSVRLPAGAAAGRFATADLPADAVQSALDTIAAQLRSADGTIAWERLAEVEPLRRPPASQLAATGVDRAIASHEPHLREVVRVPHAHLDAIVEPVLASRARRIPPRALTHLAEHSEDWQRRTLRSVIPRRILSQHAAERLDVYENRLVARTIDRVLEHLSRRDADLAAYEAQLEAVDTDDLGGPHWLARRLAALWGTTFEVEEQLQRVRELRAQVRGGRRRIRALQDSALYRAVPRHASVGSPLRMTNVLTDGQHHRHVVALWRALGTRAALDAQDACRVAQAGVRAFDAFALLLVGRALGAFGFAPPGAPSIALGRAGELTLDGPRGPLALAWDPLRGLGLRRDERPLVRFVPLAACLAGRLSGPGQDPLPRDPAWVRARVEALLADAETTREAGHVVVLYPGSREERAVLPPDVACLLNPPDAGLAPGGGCALLPVSPLDLYSEERVARVVRRVVLIDLLERYPPRVACPPSARAEATALASWLAADPAGEGLVLRAQPDAAQRARLRDRAQERARGLRRREAALRTALAELPDAVELACGAFAALAVCPTCGGDGRLIPRERHLHAGCAHCRTSWGLRPCVTCGERVPFLALDAQPRPQRGPVAPSERLDREHGRDLLALPREDEQDAFLCPACGA